ncbi:MAG: helical backbone metal receptor, partial [Flavobacteriales bacterium]
FEAISALNPDLIIANKEENNKEDIEQLERDFPVWISDINDLDSSLEMIEKVGEITSSDVTNIVDQVKVGFSELKPNSPPKTTLYLIWKGPYMAAGSGTFVHDLMSRCGFGNATNQARYPELSEEAIIKLNPELVLLSSEPFPFKEKHIQELQELLPKAEIRLVDGEMFSWYGSRLRLAPAYFQGLMKS